MYRKSEKVKQKKEMIHDKQRGRDRNRVIEEVKNIRRGLERKNTIYIKKIEKIHIYIKKWREIVQK